MALLLLGGHLGGLGGQHGWDHRTGSREGVLTRAAYAIVRKRPIALLTVSCKSRTFSGNLVALSTVSCIILLMTISKFANLCTLGPMRIYSSDWRSRIIMAALGSPRRFRHVLA
jgi:hypothetical protein